MTVDLEGALRATAPDDGVLVDVAVIAADAGLLDVAYTVTDASVGRLVLAQSDRGLLACSFDDEDAVVERLARRVSARVMRAPQRFDDIRRQLDNYLAGTRTSFSVQLDLRLAPVFGRAVLEATRHIAYGSTTTYSSIAAALGNARASRAVGNALGANPVCIVVPCHRVVRAGGALGGYAGGVSIKQRLLDLEAGAAQTS